MKKLIKIMLALIMCFGIGLTVSNILAAVKPGLNTGITQTYYHECTPGAWQSAGSSGHVKKCTEIGCGKTLASAAHSYYISSSSDPNGHRYSCRDCSSYYIGVHNIDSNTGKCTTYGCTYCQHIDAKAKWENKGTTHLRTCTSCGKQESGNHIYQAAYNETKHWIECSTCGFSDRERTEANHTYQLVYDETKHWGVCSSCGYNSRGQLESGHTYKVAYDATKHWIECSACKFTHSEENHAYAKETGKCICGVGCSHKGAKYSDKNDITHKIKCDICKYEGYEKHTLDGTGKECTVCSKTGIKKDATCSKHVYNKNSAVEGICIGCGATCTHDNKYLEKDETKHKAECKNCGYIQTTSHTWKLNKGAVDFLVKDSVKCDCGQTNKCEHNWSAKNGVCPNCTYNCTEHSYDKKAATGECKICGVGCSHPEDKIKYEKATNVETEHMKKCDVCGFSKSESHGNIAYSGQDETTHKGKCDVCQLDWKVNHTWVDDVGTRHCDLCKYICQHPSKKQKYTNADPMTHEITCNNCGLAKKEMHLPFNISYPEKNKVAHKGYCKTCELSWIEPHSPFSDGKCKCGGEIVCSKHDWSNKDGVCKICTLKCSKHTYNKDKGTGVCETCGVSCVHTNYKTYFKNDEDGHTLNCDNCGFELAAKVKHPSFDSKGKCTVCQYECKHTSEYKWVVDTSKPDQNHKKVCNVCGKQDGKTQKHNYTKAKEIGTGKCDDCGAVCDHTKYGTEKKYLNEKGHKVVCANCGKGQTQESHKYEISSEVAADKERNHIVKCACGDKKELPHEFNEEYKCTVCGYDCWHDTFNADGKCVICNKGCLHDYAKYPNKVATTHDIKCDECGYAKTGVEHNFNGDNKCDDCDYKCTSHQYNKELKDGICTICKVQSCKHKYVYTYDESKHWKECNTCGHKEEIEEVPHKYTPENYFESVDGRTHKQTCLCGYIKISNHEYGPSSRFEASRCTLCFYECDHSFGVDGKCTKCDEGCTHPEAALKAVVCDNAQSGHKIVCDECKQQQGAIKRHTYTQVKSLGEKAHIKTCECGYKEEEPHKLDEKGICTVAGCDYGCSHKYDKKAGTGICTKCEKATCTHSKVEHPNEYKTATTHREKCETCGYIKEAVEHNWKEAWVSGTSRGMECADCGYECKHDGAKEYYRDPKADTKSFIDEKHIVKCATCDQEIRTENHELDVSYIDINYVPKAGSGNCVKCGEACDHPHGLIPARETQAGDASGHVLACQICHKVTGRDVHHYTAKAYDGNNKETHKLICDCGYANQENHKFDREARTGKCLEVVCGYSCIHSQNDDDYNYIRTTDGKHNKICKICSKIVKKDEKCDLVKGACTKCGYKEECKHEESKLIWNNAVSHHIPTCQGCGKQFPKEDHKFVNNVCDKCGYSIECKHEESKLIWNNAVSHHIPTCTGCGKQFPKEDHKFVNNVCDKCGYSIECKHEESKLTWNNAVSHHIPTCTGCGKQFPKENHTLVNGICKCGYKQASTTNYSGSIELFEELENKEKKLIKNKASLEMEASKELILEYTPKNNFSGIEYKITKIEANAKKELESVKMQLGGDLKIKLPKEQGKIKLEIVGKLLNGKSTGTNEYEFTLVKDEPSNNYKCSEHNYDGSNGECTQCILERVNKQNEELIKDLTNKVQQNTAVGNESAKEELNKCEHAPRSVFFIDKTTHHVVCALCNESFYEEHIFDANRNCTLCKANYEEPEDSKVEDKVKETVYGDVNGDGKIDGRDCVVLLKHIEGYTVEITDQGLKNADVNLDGKVNGTDATIILAICAEWDIKLPAKGIVIYGDVDEDGVLSQKDIEKLTQYVEKTTTLSAQAKKNADFNGDGKVNNTDIVSLRSYIASQKDKEFIQVLLEPGKTKEIICGDVNEDEVVDLDDALLILQYENKFEEATISEQGLKNADVNVDGKVNGTDSVIIMAIDVGWDIKLPAKGIVIYGDVDEDGVLSQKDIEKLTQYAEKTTTLSAQAKKNADFNGDGKVNNTDIVSLRSYIASQKDKESIQVLLEPGKTIDRSHCIATQHTFNPDGACTTCLYICNMHTYDKTTGICTICGVACKHGQYKASYNKVKVTATTHMEKCNNCGYIQTVEHKFDVNTSKCVCGKQYECAHEFNEEGLCSLCGYSCNKHTYDKTTGICTICGVACKHGQYKASYNKVKVTATTHMEKCNNCGYIQTVEHTFNEKGSCAKCRYQKNYYGTIELWKDAETIIKNKASIEMEVGEALKLEYTPKENFGEIQYRITIAQGNTTKKLEPVKMELKDSAGNYRDLEIQLPNIKGKIKLEIKGKLLNGKQTESRQYVFNLVDRY